MQYPLNEKIGEPEQSIERISLAGIARVVDVSESWLQNLDNEYLVYSALLRYCV